MKRSHHEHRQPRTPKQAKNGKPAAPPHATVEELRAALADPPYRFLTPERREKALDAGAGC